MTSLNQITGHNVGWLAHFRFSGSGFRPGLCDIYRSPERITAMRCLLFFGFVWVVSCACASAQVLTNGLSMAVGTTAMEKAGYRKTELEMMPNPGEEIKFWHVGQGVLIASYSNTSRKIIKLTFWFADDRPKSTRQTFEFDVSHFDTGTGVMVIRTRTGEAKGGANRSQPIRSDTSSTSAAAGSPPSP